MQTIVTQTSYYIGTFQTVFETQHISNSGILTALLSWYLQQVSQECKTTPGNQKKHHLCLCPHPGDGGTAVEGGIRMEQEQPVLGKGDISDLGVTLPTPILPPPAAARRDDIDGFNSTG